MCGGGPISGLDVTSATARAPFVSSPVALNVKRSVSSQYCLVVDIDAPMTCVDISTNDIVSSDDADDVPYPGGDGRSRASRLRDHAGCRPAHRRKTAAR